MAFSFMSQQPQQQQSPFQLPQQQQPLFQTQQQTQQQQLYLFTNDNTPATYNTKWADLHPHSQNFLLQIQERVLEYRDESQRLDQCIRLTDSSVSYGGLDLDASRLFQELGGVSTGMDRQKAISQELLAVANDMMRNTEIAVRSFMMLRPRFHQPQKGTAGSATDPSQASGATAGPLSSGQTATSVVPVYDFYSGLPKKPSPYLQQAVSRFEKYLLECLQWVEELEQLILPDSEKNTLSSDSSLLQSLPKVMSNVHDFFLHVAAKVESIHQYIESMKSAYLTDQRCRGERNDPFLEADRRETAKHEAAARRVHPTLHLPANSQASVQAVGSIASSAAPGSSLFPNSSVNVPSASSGSGLSLFSTPSVATSSPSLFITPTTSAPVSLLSSGASPQPSLFGPSSSTPAIANTPPLFSSTQSFMPSLSTPFASGGATVSGSSFNTASKARGKSRTGRR
ncbi:transporter [Lithospermum erythrorhizon]|uniref:Transporter n=1 Tax=Lithospermum erythrorhizon TaxID=34254 RepID=A0AAV3R425_LITER